LHLRKVVQSTGLIVLLTLAAAITAPLACAAPSAPLGVVMQSQKALLGNVYLADGTSLYDGDTISTQGKGSLRVRLGLSQLFLGENSSVTLRRSGNGISAVLSSGSARFSNAAGTPLEFKVLDAVIRGKQESAAGQVAVIDADRFQVGSTSGTLTVDVNGDVRPVEEGTAYEATLSPADPQMPQPTGRRRSILLWIVIGLVAAGTIIAIHHATMSPHKM